MRVALLAGANSVHTVQWANGLAKRGLDVHVLTVHEPNPLLGKDVTVHQLSSGPPLGFVSAHRNVRRLLRKLRPDLVHAHRATGYAWLARRAGYRPWLVSVWGGDVYDFPVKSLIHRRFVVANLRAADAIASTSHAMARKVREIIPNRLVSVTPFGVDHHRFSPSRRREMEGVLKPTVTIGTVKTLAPKYGIDTLLRSFALLKRELRDEGSSMADKLRLLIVGGGPERESLERLAHELRIADVTEFRGPVPHTEVPRCLAELDVYVALSRLDSESFGVAILEASACGVPVVVSDADGPREVVVDGQTGFIVRRDDPEQAANAIRKLIFDEQLRVAMGEAGRRHVLANYTWDRCLDIMLELYERTISQARLAER